ncbi:MAG: CheR family methyltransferase, partial [Myxococcota bacterium]
AVDAPEALAGIVLDGLRYPKPPNLSREPRRAEEALARILRAVVGATSASARHYKDSTFERRVQRRMLDLNLGNLASYAEFVERDEAEAHRLRESLLIGVTQFFRDTDAFSVVARQVVPELISRSRTDGRAIRVWVPGCATGEEAYTIAMLFMDATKDSPESLDLQIFATDLKRDFLTEAARGEYSAQKIANIPADLRDTYFMNEPGGEVWTVHPEVRRSIVFAPHDILSDPPFTRLDFISCRNLLIYFSLEAQQQVLSSFAFGLSDQGFLLLGPSESVGGLRESFEFVDARQRVFRRTGNTQGAKPFLFASGRRDRSAVALGERRPTRLREAKLMTAYSALLSSYAPPGLLVNTERELLHTFGGAREYTRPPDGAAHLDVAEMVDPNLKTPILAGIDRALRESGPVTFSKVDLATFPEPGRTVDLTVQPLAEAGATIQQLLILIQPHEGHAAPQVRSTLVNASEIAQERIVELENELERTREALQSTIEEIETANEELQSSNEELMSSNEELQSTNEELSSVNEELYSVNAEYHRQNDELARLNGDFDLLLRATEIGVIFLDGDLCITRFTGLAGQKFGLANSDIKRSFGTFRSPFVDGEPLTLLENSL